MKKNRNFLIARNRGRAILADFFYEPANQNAPLIIFCHGYKGFKDWGAWDQMGEEFVRRGHAFLKFNFSHNGGTIEEPIDFPDLEAFGNNNYTTEVTDLHKVLDQLQKVQEIDNGAFDPQKIVLLGHSRAGGIVLITAHERKDIYKVATLAGVSDYASRFPKGQEMQQWKENGVYHVKNGRTGQQMPHYIQFYEDFQENRERLNIQHAVENLRIPQLIIHGSDDETVSLEEARSLAKWNPQAQYEVIEGAGHTFNTSHPWQKSAPSPEMKKAVSYVDGFIERDSFLG